MYIYIELAPKLTATASVAQSVERWPKDLRSRVQFPAGGLGVAFFANVYLSDTRIYLTLKNNLSNECLVSEFQVQLMSRTGVIAGCLGDHLGLLASC